MSKFILALIVVAAFVAVYFIWVRPYLAKLPSWSDVNAKEMGLWQKIKHWLEGRKTVLVGLWGSVLGLGPDVLNIFTGVDLQKLLHLPEQWALWVSAVAVPLLMVLFRTAGK